MKQFLRAMVLMALLCVGAAPAWAFPSWMGVYGVFERHTDANPGTYAILMNQDYFGLHAEIGVQVNGGAWTTLPMTWLGNVDGNSQWGFTPAVPYPAGATVKYYFHGYDDWGGNIYDSRNGQNYEFTTAGGGGGVLTWSAPAALPTGSGAVGVDIAAYNGALYAVWGTRSNEYNSDLTIYLSKKTGNTWDAPTFVTSLSAYLPPHIAVSASGIHLVFNDWNNLFYIRSENGGQTWTSPIVVSNAFYPEIRADADYAYLVYNEYGAPDTSRIFFRKLYKNDSDFGPAVGIFTNVSYKTTVYVRDFDVVGSRLSLLTYSMSWYGGFYQYFIHESQDAGTTWTGGEQPGQGAHIAAHADGRLSYVAVDSGASGTGAGLYFQSKPYGGSWISYLNVWPGDGTADALRLLNGVLVAVSQRSGLRYYRTSGDNGITWGSPVLFNSDNSWCTKDVSDATSMHLLLAQYGTSTTYATVSTTGSGGTPVQWIGNTYPWPPNGQLGPSDDLWVNCETYPKDAATNVQIVYTINGGVNWVARDLSRNGATPANDMWHIDLGVFSGGTTVRYAIVAQDGVGGETWDNNGGQDYRSVVSSAVNVQAPIFWGLDPYRYDNEKVRVNGAAGYGSRNFGQFPTGQAITVVSRPVENGNGNLVQMGPVSIVSLLHYTTTPGDWSSSVTVTGVFHGAGFSNKPIFDYFSYAIGALPPGAQVEFWLDAANAAGTTYAQAADANFMLSIAGASNGDSDNDGLPDAWEMEWFSNLVQTAVQNDDGDGPVGRPMANIVEYAIGTNPKVPNDPMGVRLLWAPAYPQAGETVTLSYFYVNEGNPLFGKPVYAHVGENGWQYVFDTPQLSFNGQVSRFEVQVQVPADATELNVVFHDNAGTWDNNGGQDWHIPIQPAPVPSPTAASTLSTTSLKSDIGNSTLESTTAKSIAVSASSATSKAAPSVGSSMKRASVPDDKPVTVTVALLGVKKTKDVFAHIGCDGWKKAIDAKMKRRADGSMTIAYQVPPGHHDINVAFRDDKGSWYTHGGAGWVFTIAGNGDQTIVIEP